MQWLKRWFTGRTNRPRSLDRSLGDDTSALEQFMLPRFKQKATAEEEFPAFLASAIDRPLTRGERGDMVRARMILRDLFTPAQPVTDRSQFAGRLDVLVKLIEIIEAQRSHVVVYGERGIGKTSLLHILADIARDSLYLVVYASCGARSRFDEMFRAILRDIPLLYLSSVSPTQAEAEGGASLADRLPPGSFNARELSDICSEITGTRVLIILDEYDRIEDPAFRQGVAELIKNLSDRAARVQLVMAGVASNLQELIGYIPSIRRNVIGIPMTRLSNTEVQALMGLGEAGAGIRFDAKVVELVTLLSNGSPYLVRLLSHHSSMIALDDLRLNVELGDLAKALDKIVEEAESRLAARTMDQVNELWRQPDRNLLAIVARESSTPDGSFSLSDLQRQWPTTDVAGPDRLMTALAAPEGLIEADLSGEPRYRFRDEALPLYLTMRIARDHFRDEAMGDARLPINRTVAAS